VTLGSRTGDQYDIPDGLKAGDQVVVDGGLSFSSCKINERRSAPTATAPRRPSIMNRIVASSLGQPFSSSS
jgi:multidrug efflux pump subunit AcrA (membrane-fusion protein)